MRFAFWTLFIAIVTIGFPNAAGYLLIEFPPETTDVEIARIYGRMTGIGVMAALLGAFGLFYKRNRLAGYAVGCVVAMAAVIAAIVLGNLG